MTALRVIYPWDKLKRGQGFFVPCLDTEAVKEDGLHQALKHRIFYPKYKIGIKDGKIGVLFYLRS